MTDIPVITLSSSTKRTKTKQEQLFGNGGIARWEQHQPKAANLLNHINTTVISADYDDVEVNDVDTVTNALWEMNVVNGVVPGLRQQVIEAEEAANKKQQLAAVTSQSSAFTSKYNEYIEARKELEELASSSAPTSYVPPPPQVIIEPTSVEKGLISL